MTSTALGEMDQDGRQPVDLPTPPTTSTPQHNTEQAPTQHEPAGPSILLHVLCQQHERSVFQASGQHTSSSSEFDRFERQLQAERDEATKRQAQMQERFECQLQSRRDEATKRQAQLQEQLLQFGQQLAA